jgi:hypothetical protein
LGHPLTGVGQAAAEGTTIGWGYSLSRREPLTLDGVPELLPDYRRREPSSQDNLEQPLAADILQEFGIKYHMVNTFDAYREAAQIQAKQDGTSLRLMGQGIDDRPSLDLFLDPFRSENLTDPWVWIPLALIGGVMAVDYYTVHQGNIPSQQRLTPNSNFLYAFNNGLWQPVGSGAPEEMFYRGFLQNELYSLVPSPFFSIPISTLAFSFSHAPGSGRITSAFVGAYLGYLAYRFQGHLGRGITLHFWGDFLLGLESILLNNDAQRTTPPASFTVQINY